MDIYLLVSTQAPWYNKTQQNKSISGNSPKKNLQYINRINTTFWWKTGKNSKCIYYLATLEIKGLWWVRSLGYGHYLASAFDNIWLVKEICFGSKMNFLTSTDVCPYLLFLTKIKWKFWIRLVWPIFFVMYNGGFIDWSNQFNKIIVNVKY